MNIYTVQIGRILIWTVFVLLEYKKDINYVLKINLDIMVGW